MSTSKAEIRNAGLKGRDGIDPERRSAYADRLAKEGMRLVQEFGRGKPIVVSLFSPIGSEPDPALLAATLQAAGHTLALPVDWSTGTPLVYRRWIPGDRLAIGPLGISEPLDTAPSLDPDVLFVPLAGFDRRGHRVGYGAGNVDRTLAWLRARKRIFALGVAYAEQEMAWVPEEFHDEALDLVITDRETVICGI
jgi:5-formyltetrahydrofolate cyclo-ligase